MITADLYERADAEDGPRGTAEMVNVSSVAGRTVRLGSGLYNATKHAVGAFSESLRQEVTGRHVRVGLVEPGVTATELAGRNRPRGARGHRFTVTRPRHVAVNELLVRPTEQEL